jgi:uncharacterized protein YggU (UPF0235/DUF167 family)
VSALRIHLIPGGSLDRIDGRMTDADGQTLLKARVRAVPENFEANRALEAMIAKAYGVSKTKVKVTRGQTARLKTIEIDGASDADVAAFIAKYPEKA